MIVIFFILILLLIILTVSKHYYNYQENFTSKCSSIKYTPTCDKRKMYNKLSSMAANLSKINYKMNKLEYDASKTELNKMYLWYKKQVELEKKQKKIGYQNAMELKNRLGQQAIKDNAAIDKKYMKKDAKRHNKQVSKYKSLLSF